MHLNNLLQKNKYQLFGNQIIFLKKLFDSIQYNKVAQTQNNYLYKRNIKLSSKISKTQKDTQHTTHRNTNVLFSFLRRIDMFYWIKISWKGKGCRIRKFRNKNKITFSFGRSHWSKLVYNNKIFIKKLKRQNYMTTLNSLYDVYFLKKQISSVKPINRYTLRGVRCKSQKIKRRFGKISQVHSIWH